MNKFYFVNYIKIPKIKVDKTFKNFLIDELHRIKFN